VWCRPVPRRYGNRHPTAYTKHPKTQKMLPFLATCEAGMQQRRNRSQLTEPGVDRFQHEQKSIYILRIMHFPLHDHTRRLNRAADGTRKEAQDYPASRNNTDVRLTYQTYTLLLTCKDFGSLHIPPICQVEHMSQLPTQDRSGLSHRRLYCATRNHMIGGLLQLFALQ